MVVWSRVVVAEMKKKRGDRLGRYLGGQATGT